MAKQSTAIEPGMAVAISTESTLVIDDVAADRAQAVIFQNNSDEAITVRPAATGAEPFLGIVLNANGGIWYDENLATAVCACHHGASGEVDLTVVLL